MKKLLVFLLSFSIVLSVFSATNVNAAARIKVTSSMIKGASIRLVGPNGIRWYTEVDTAKIAQLKAEGHTVTMGTLIAPVDTLESELTQKTGYKVDIPFDSDEYYTEGTFTGIVGSIVNIHEEHTDFNPISGNILRKFVGRGYVCVDGFYSYATQNDNFRSINDVASFYKESLSGDEFAALSETKKANINRWLTAFDGEDLLSMYKNKEVVPESLGFPADEFIVNSKNTYARNIWDLAVVDNKVVMGYGDYSENSGADYGGTPLFFYNNFSTTKHMFKVQNGSGAGTDDKLSTEAAQRFFMIDGTLFTLSTDPLLMNDGSYYAYDAVKGKWIDYYKLPLSVHCYDMVKYDGDYYFSGMVQDGNHKIDYCVQRISGDKICTDAKAQNLELYDFEGNRLDGPIYKGYNSSTGEYYDVQTTYYWRAYDIFTFKGELYISHSNNSNDTNNSYSGLFKYDKERDAFYQVTSGDDLKGFLAVARNNTITVKNTNGNYTTPYKGYYDFETNTPVSGAMKVGMQEIHDEIECPFKEQVGDNFIVIKNGIFKSSDVEKRSNAFEKVSLGEGFDEYVPRDAFEHNGKYYVLASKQNDKNDFSTIVFETDENFENFERVVSFNTKAYARSFIFNNGCLYVGLGGDGKIDNNNTTNEYSDYTGELLRINFFDFVK